MQLKSKTKIKHKNSDSLGLVIAFYGDGKGKTSAAIGTLIRSVSSGRKSAFLQFVKGDWVTNEEKFLRKIDGVLFEKLGKGFVNENPLKHVKAAKEALGRAGEILKSDYDLVVLDEILTALELNIVTVESIIKLLNLRKKTCDLVITGLKLPDEVMSRCDIATQMKKKKHIFDKGVLAKNGIDF